MIYFKEALKIIETEYIESLDAIRTQLIKDVENLSPSVIVKGRVGFKTREALNEYIQAIIDSLPKKKLKKAQKTISEEFGRKPEALYAIAKKYNKSVQAVAFAFDTSDTAFSALAQPITIKDLVLYMKTYAVFIFGCLARTVLSEIGINSTRDFGELVMCLINESYIKMDQTESIDEFNDVFDFSEIDSDADKYLLEDVKHWGQKENVPTHNS